MNTVISPVQAREARASAQYSQAQVARETGISRTKLALFEVEKYLLDDETLTTLREFYEGRGVEIDSNCEIQAVGTNIEIKEASYEPRSTGISLVDGFAIPEGIDSEHAEALLTIIVQNDSQITALAEKEAEKDGFIFEADHEERDQLLVLMAQNYQLARRLQGREILIPTAKHYSNANAVGDLFSN